MGNQSTVVEKFTDAHLAKLDHYDTIRNEESHQLFGRCSLMVRKTNQKQQVVCKQIPISDESHMIILQNQIESLMQLNHPHLLKVYGYSLYNKSRLCSESHCLTAYCEFYLTSLQQEIEFRQKSEKVFEMNEIWVIARSLIKVLEYLDETGNGNRQLRGEYVFLTEQGGVKVANQTLIDVFSDFSNYNYTAKFSYQKEGQNNQLFQAGIILLQSALLQDCSYLFSSEGKIDEMGLDFLIEQVNSKYGEQLFMLLKKLLKFSSLSKQFSYSDIFTLFPPIYPKSSRSSMPSTSRKTIKSDEASPPLKCFRLNSSFINNLQKQQNFEIESSSREDFNKEQKYSVNLIKSSANQNHKYLIDESSATDSHLSKYSSYNQVKIISKEEISFEEKIPNIKQPSYECDRSNHELLQNRQDFCISQKDNSPNQKDFNEIKNGQKDQILKLNENINVRLERGNYQSELQDSYSKMKKAQSPQNNRSNINKYQNKQIMLRPNRQTNYLKSQSSVKNRYQDTENNQIIEKVKGLKHGQNMNLISEQLTQIKKFECSQYSPIATNYMNENKRYQEEFHSPSSQKAGFKEQYKLNCILSKKKSINNSNKSSKNFII